MDIKDSLASLLQNDNLTNLTVTDELPNKNLIPKKTTYSDIKTKAEAKAKKILSTMLKFYVSENFISENEYVQCKIEMDRLSLTGLIYQLEASEKAITTLLETIDNGEIHPRMFEVLAQLQKSYLDILKHQTMYLVTTEEHLKRIKNDYDVYQTTKLDEGSGKGKLTGNTFRGTRGLIMELQKEEPDMPESGFSEEEIDIEE